MDTSSSTQALACVRDQAARDKVTTKRALDRDGGQVGATTPAAASTVPTDENSTSESTTIARCPVCGAGATCTRCGACPRCGA